MSSQKFFENVFLKKIILKYWIIKSTKLKANNNFFFNHIPNIFKIKSMTNLYVIAFLNFTLLGLLLSVILLYNENVNNAKLLNNLYFYDYWDLIMYLVINYEHRWIKYYISLLFLFFSKYCN